jgi:subtilisin family serine protease
LLAVLLALPSLPAGPRVISASGECESSTTAAALRSQHLIRLGVEQWHRSGYLGRGVKVAILDSGFRGYRDHLNHSLPAQVAAKSFRLDGNLEARDSQHGILCAEVIHAIAPETELLFANWEPDRPETFLNAIRWARQQGARLLSCSVIMPSWSDGEGGGPVHERLAGLLGNGARAEDQLLFASAGNTAERHWSGPFHDDGNGYHEWAAGQIDNRVLPWGRDQVSIEVCWGDDCAYDLEVLDRATRSQVGHCLTRGRAGHACAVVKFVPEAAHTYFVRVRRAGGKAGPFHLVALGAGLDRSTARGSISFPGDGPEVVTVGAVDADGQRLTYSSCGPNSRQPKPDLVAAVPFPSVWRPKPFSGTSAAAPQAVALGALWWARHPEWTANQVRQALRTTARDLGPPGHDFETGYGLITLPWERLAAFEERLNRLAPGATINR